MQKAIETKDCSVQLEHLPEMQYMLEASKRAAEAQQVDLPMGRVHGAPREPRHSSPTRSRENYLEQASEDTRWDPLTQLAGECERLHLSVYEMTQLAKHNFEVAKEADTLLLKRFNDQMEAEDQLRRSWHEIDSIGIQCSSIERELKL